MNGRHVNVTTAGADPGASSTSSKRGRGRPPAKRDASQTPANHAVKRRKEKKTAVGTSAAAAASSSSSSSSSSATPILRDMPQSYRFSKDEWQSLISQKLLDRNSRWLIRERPRTEVLVMALNEVAAEAGRLFFMHLPSRETWKYAGGEALIPAQRVPKPPGSQYPSLVCMDFTWDADSRAAFLANSQRARYLKSNFLINPPIASTPLFAIQLPYYKSFPVYKTTPASLVVISTTSACYPATTTELEQLLGFKRPGGTCVDRHLQLDIPFSLFRSADSAAGTEVDTRLNGFRETSLRSLYQKILGRTRSELSSTFTAQELMTHILPRPSAPDSVAGAVGLGTPFEGEEVCLADPPSRFGERHQKKASSARRDESEEDGGPDLDEDER